MTTHSKRRPDAENALVGLHKRFCSWRKVAANLGGKKKFDAGLLARIASGKQAAPNSVLLALGLSPRTAEVPACPKCGKGHPTKRCIEKPTFEEREAKGNKWLARNLDKINGIVAWATTANKGA